MENVFKISTTCPRVREFLRSQGWEFQGKDNEMDSLRNKKTGKELFVEDISEDFSDLSHGWTQFGGVQRPR
jgi:hypothetical protein